MFSIWKKANLDCLLFLWVHQCEGGDSGEKSLSLFIAPDGYAILMSHKICFGFELVVHKIVVNHIVLFSNFAVRQLRGIAFGGSVD